MSHNPTAPVIDPVSVDAAITSRMSARAFLPQPVPRASSALSSAALQRRAPTEVQMA